MNVFAYTAYKNPHKAANIIRKYGGRPAKDKYQLGRQLANAVKIGGQPALDEVAKAHPDYNMISDELNKGGDYSNMAGGEHSNACGCGGYANADGNGNNGGILKRFDSKTETLMVGGIILIGLALVLKHTSK